MDKQLESSEKTKNALTFLFSGLSSSNRMDPFRPPVFVDASKVPASRAAREMRVPSGTVTFFSMIGTAYPA